MNRKWSLLFSQCLPLQLLCLILPLWEEVPLNLTLLLLGLTFSGSLLGWFGIKHYFQGEKPFFYSTLRWMILYLMAFFLVLGIVQRPLFHYGRISFLRYGLMGIPFTSWLLSTFILKPFFYQEFLLLQLKVDKGPGLKDRIRTHSYYMGHSQKNFIKLKRFLGFLTLLLCLPVLFYTPNDSNKLFLFQSSYILNFALLLYWGFRIKLTVRAESLLTEGFLPDRKEENLRSRHFLFWIFLFITAAIALSFQRSIFSLQRLWAFIMDFLSRIFNRKEAPSRGPILPPAPEPAPQPAPPPDEMYLTGISKEISAPWIGKAFMAILLLLFVGALAYYLIFPLLKQNRRISANTTGREKFSLKRWFHDLLKKIKGLFHQSPREKLVRLHWDKREGGFVKKEVRQKISQGDPFKTRQKSLWLYYRLTKWGKKKGIPYQKGLGPQKYCLTLSKGFPEVEGLSFQQAGQWFQEFFYSPKPPDQDRLEQLKKWIKTLEKRRFP